MTYQSQILSLSPLLYLPLMETSGTPGPAVFADASGNGHAGSLDSYTTAGGANSFLTAEKAATLGANAYINFAGGSGFGAFTDFTVEFWLQLQGSLYTTHDWLTLHLDDWPASHAINLELDQTAGPGIQTIIDNSYGVSDAGVVPFAHVDCWHHYVVVYDSGAGQVRRYVDGVLGSTRSVGVNPAFTATDGYITAFDGPFNLAQLALYGAALTGAEVAANYAAAIPRQDAACFVDWVRLSHVSGQGYWQSSGDVIEEWAGGIKQVSWPLPMLGTTPDTLVGKDPVSAMPAYCPAPVPTTTTVVLGGGAGSVPAAPTVCVQMRCGVAGECTDHLLSLYEQWAAWIDPLVAGITDFALIALLIDPFFDGLIAGLELASDIAIAKAIEQVIKLGVGAISGSLFPGLNPDQQQGLKKAVFCALTCTGDAVTVSTANISTWHDAVAAVTGLPGLSRDLLTLLLQFTPLADWQARASQSGPSSACGGWTCP